MKRKDAVKIMVIFTALVITLIFVIQNAKDIDDFSLDDLNKKEKRLEAASE